VQHRELHVSGTRDIPGDAQKEWRLEYYDYTDQAIGRTYPLPIMTDGSCRVIVNGLWPVLSRFTYEEIWADMKLEFAFEAGVVDPNTYQVLLGRALEKHPELWTGSSRDAELLGHLMSNMRQALSLLRTGPSEETRIRTVEFILSRGWSRWTTFAGFQTEERVR
jgi:hypothetical protein